MASTKSMSPLRGRRIRVTREDGCGRPVYGAASSLVSKGFVTVAATAITNETEEIRVTNAAGEVCVFEPASSTIIGYGVDIEFCDVDPDMISVLTGQSIYADAFGATVGFKVNSKLDLSGVGFGLEMWLGVGNVDACAVGATGKYGYLLLPYLKGGYLGDFTIEDGAISFTITGATTRDGNNWGVGPYADVMFTNLSVAGPLVTALGVNDHLLLIQTDVAPPEPATGARPLLNSATTAITSISRVISTAYNVTFTTTPAATGPVYWDFGDGTWDYVAAPGSTAHVYPAVVGKTYTARATTNGTTWRTASVSPVA